MDLFNLSARLTLDRTSYEAALRSSTVLTKEGTNQIKAKFKEMSDSNVAEMQKIIKAFRDGTITFDEYKKKIDEIRSAQSKLDNESQQLGITTQKSGLAAVAGWAAVATAIVAVIKKIGDLAMATANYADQIGDLAEKWGFTTQQIQEFDYWATQNGTTLEGLLTGMRGLVNQAQAGSDAFNKLGVSVRDSSGNLKDQRTLFLDTITALQGVENQTERNALQFDIFGRAGIELGQVINLTGDQLEALSQKAQDYGLIISDEAIKKSSDFNDELDTLKKQFQSLVAEMLAGTPESEEKFRLFMQNMEETIQKYLPVFTKFIIRFGMAVTRGLIEALPQMIDALFDAIFEINWLELGLKIGESIVKGILNAIWNSIQWIFGKGWLWNDAPAVSVDNTSTDTALSSITTTSVGERTTKVDETLDITLSVESDGTVAGQQNLDIISDMMTDKINKALGDMVNG